MLAAMLDEASWPALDGQTAGVELRSGPVRFTGAADRRAEAPTRSRPRAWKSAGPGVDRLGHLGRPREAGPGRTEPAATAPNRPPTGPGSRRTARGPGLRRRRAGKIARPCWSRPRMSPGSRSCCTSSAPRSSRSVRSASPCDTAPRARTSEAGLEEPHEHREDDEGPAEACSPSFRRRSTRSRSRPRPAACDRHRADERQEGAVWR